MFNGAGQRWTPWVTFNLGRHAEYLSDARAAYLGFIGAAGAASGGGGGGPGISYRLSWPVDARISSDYGNRSGGFHDGVDLAVATGTTVHAAQQGRVVVAGWNGGYGNYVRINHGTIGNTHLESFYGHLSRIDVRIGQGVAHSQRIGLSGSTGKSTGPHVHFGVHADGKPSNPHTWVGGVQVGRIVSALTGAVTGFGAAGEVGPGGIVTGIAGAAVRAINAAAVEGQLDWSDLIHGSVDSFRDVLGMLPGLAQAIRSQTMAPTPGVNSKARH